MFLSFVIIHILILYNIVFFLLGGDVIFFLKIMAGIIYIYM